MVAMHQKSQFHMHCDAKVQPRSTGCRRPAFVTGVALAAEPDLSAVYLQDVGVTAYKGVAGSISSPTILTAAAGESFPLLHTQPTIAHVFSSELQGHAALVI